jgi:hypothetical protein
MTGGYITFYVISHPRYVGVIYSEVYNIPQSFMYYVLYKTLLFVIVLYID